MSEGPMMSLTRLMRMRVLVKHCVLDEHRHPVRCRFAVRGQGRANGDEQNKIVFASREAAQAAADELTSMALTVRQEAYLCKLEPYATDWHWHLSKKRR